MRFHLAAGLAALSLAGCSGGNEAAAPEPVPSAAEATILATPAPAQGEPPAPATPAAAAGSTLEPTRAPAPTGAPVAEPAPTPTLEPAKAADTAPPAAFARCVACHSAEKGAPDKIGPNLFGVFGKKAAQGSFGFSDALKGAGLTLDEATLHKWLENPRTLVPGNRMSFPGVKDPAKRQEIIDYLKRQR